MAEGLRERKMRMSRHRMEQAAVDLAYEGGIESVSVDRICEIAEVSRSTFFNYFPSIEQAIFGPPLEYEAAVTERILSENGRDLAVAASLLVTELVRGQSQDAVTRRRLALFSREPGTTVSVSWASRTSRQRLVDVIENWLNRHPELASLPGDDHGLEARLIVTLSISIGDEAIRDVLEVEGELDIDPEHYRRARRRLGTIMCDLD